MIKIYDFGWTMEISFEYICIAITTGELRRMGYKFGNMRKLYRLILKYGDKRALDQMDSLLKEYPKAKAFFEGGKYEYCHN